MSHHCAGSSEFPSFADVKCPLELSETNVVFLSYCTSNYDTFCKVMVGVAQNRIPLKVLNFGGVHPDHHNKYRFVVEEMKVRTGGYGVCACECVCVCVCACVC